MAVVLWKCESDPSCTVSIQKNPQPIFLIGPTCFDSPKLGPITLKKRLHKFRTEPFLLYIDPYIYICIVIALISL